MGRSETGVRYRVGEGVRRGRAVRTESAGAGVAPDVDAVGAARVPTGILHHVGGALLPPLRPSLPRRDAAARGAGPQQEARHGRPTATAQRRQLQHRASQL